MHYEVNIVVSGMFMYHLQNYELQLEAWTLLSIDTYTDYTVVAIEHSFQYESFESLELLQYNNNLLGNNTLTFMSLRKKRIADMK